MPIATRTPAPNSIAQTSSAVRPEPKRKLPESERKQVLDVLHEHRFADWAPVQVWAQLIQEGTHLCSPRTMHRILAENAELRERRNQLRRPRYEARMRTGCWKS